MAINPMAMLKMKERLSLFQQEHPRVTPFFQSLRADGLAVGSIYELKVTLPDGREKITNIRLTENDVQTIQMLLKEQG